MIRHLVLASLCSLVGLSIAISPSQAARASKTTKTVITKTSTESDGADEPVATPFEPKENVMTAQFGASTATGMNGCKTPDLSRSIVKELKVDCQAWLKDRKAELKKKYLVGTCDETCTDCGMGLQRCTVSGSVRYTVISAD